MTKRTMLSALIACACIVFTGSSDAATVQTDQACYPAIGSSGVDITVTGQGFTSGELVEAEVPD